MSDLPACAGYLPPTPNDQRSNPDPTETAVYVDLDKTDNELYEQLRQLEPQGKSITAALLYSRTLLETCSTSDLQTPQDVQATINRLRQIGTIHAKAQVQLAEHSRYAECLLARCRKELKEANDPNSQRNRESLQQGIERSLVSSFNFGSERLHRTMEDNKEKLLTEIQRHSADVPTKLDELKDGLAGLSLQHRDSTVIDTVKDELNQALARLPNPNLNSTVSPAIKDELKRTLERLSEQANETTQSAIATVNENLGAGVERLSKQYSQTFGVARDGLIKQLDDLLQQNQTKLTADFKQHTVNLEQSWLQHLQDFQNTLLQHMKRELDGDLNQAGNVQRLLHEADQRERRSFAETAQRERLIAEMAELRTQLSQTLNQNNLAARPSSLATPGMTQTSNPTSAVSSLRLTPSNSFGSGQARHSSGLSKTPELNADFMSQQFNPSRKRYRMDASPDDLLGPTSFNYEQGSNDYVESISRARGEFNISPTQMNPVHAPRQSKANLPSATRTTSLEEDDEPGLHSLAEIWQGLSFWDEAKQIRKPATELSPAVRNAIEPSLQKFRAPTRFKGMFGSSRSLVCCHVRAARRNATTSALVTCNYCLTKNYACIVVQGNFPPTLVPLPADRRPGVTAAQPGYWVPA